MRELDLFTGEPGEEQVYSKIIPVSVVDIFSQEKREKQNHAQKSSRQTYSPFPTEISDLCYELYLKDCDAIADFFAGWGERHNKAKEFHKAYTGFDTSQAALDNALKEYEVINFLGDSRIVEVPDHNGLITCPPYWNLEKYEGKGIDKIPTWNEFIKSMETIFGRFYEKADSGSIYCVMVGDWRKDHKYYDLDYQISKIFNSLGAEPIDKIICNRKIISKIKIMIPQARRLGYTVRVHENLSVFKKP